MTAPENRRAVSTVVDVTVCLLLISAGIVALTLPVSEPPPDRKVDNVAALVGTTTANVSYNLSYQDLPDLSVGQEQRSTRRHRHSTIAGLLAQAAITNVSVKGPSVAPEAAGFRSAVRKAARRVIPARLSATARWEPYPGAPVSGTVTAGDPPPKHADYQVATLTVPVSAMALRGDPGTATSYRDAATLTARAIVEGTLPDRYGTAPTGDNIAVQTVIHRSRLLSGNESLPARAYLVSGDVSALTDRVTEALADRLVSDLRTQFKTPAEAVAAVEPGTVTVVVRGWTA